MGEEESKVAGTQTQQIKRVRGQNSASHNRDAPPHGPPRAQHFQKHLSGLSTCRHPIQRPDIGISTRRTENSVQDT